MSVAWVRRRVVAGPLAAALIAVTTPGAYAVAPVGACCLADGGCEELTALQCDGPGQSFVGEGTSCSTTNCAAPVEAPALSILGLVAATGALAALGVGRLVARRRAG